VKKRRGREGKEKQSADRHLGYAVEGNRRRTVWIALGSIAAIVIVVGIAVRTQTPREAPDLPHGERITARARPDFVGSQQCISCHAAEYHQWQGSHHALAMAKATDETVLGNFNDARFTYAGVTSTFFRRDGRFMVRTDGPDGRLADFEVAYTFGVEPLQQYLIPFPDGRLQALSIAWDSRPRDQGGQRWFHLYPTERITHQDDLHWTGLQQNWNYMCADCHSTNLRKNYFPETDRYQTTWSEINVACEACHGPGSDHLAWAEAERAGAEGRWDDKGLRVSLPRPPGWSIDPATGRPVMAERASRAEIMVCAQCHARRGQFGDGYIPSEPLLDYHQIELVLPDLYHADGQQKDEVFTYGSFRQSKMYQAGVTCTHCHNPHSGELRAPGNQVCGQCHLPARYEAPEHHFHPQESEGAECVSCHMPATTYMVVDPRRDHSFLTPRPDLSLALGVPNPCTGCHADQSTAWAADRMVEWYGRVPTGFQRFAEAFHADEQNRPGAAAALVSIAEDPSHASIVRASALERLARRPSTAVRGAARGGVADPEPLVRLAALSLIGTLPGADRANLGAALLGDSIRAVRLRAAWVLAPERSRLMPERELAFQRAAEEFIVSKRYLADRPESRVTLGTFYVQLGRLAEAEAEYRAATELLPSYAPAFVNLADLYRARGQEAHAEQTLRAGIAAAPEVGVLHHALGLSLVRTGRTAEALEALQRAAALAPEDARIVYTHGVALHSTNRVGEAVRVLGDALQRHPGNREILFALASFHRDAGNREEALRYAEQLLEIDPADPQARALRQSLAGSRAPLRY
jgi:tetratricopeptide (TPR) repeat protein